jgi:threonyl-tRNA synthetase
MAIKVTLPKNKVVEIEEGSTPYEIFKEHAPESLKDALVARFNGDLIDIHRGLDKDGELEVLGFSDERGREVYWHSSSHLMAQAIKELYPTAQLAIGPAISDGFYYDIDLDTSLSPDDLATLEAKMKELSKQRLTIKREEIQKGDAIKLFSEIDENYKIELLEEMDSVISIYRQGNFVDLCRGPHLPNTGYIKHFKLLSIAGAYWRGDENNKMLQRIYGASYPDRSQLEGHLRLLEEAKKRDHRKLGRELDLYSVSEDVGSGLILWHPKAALIRHIIEHFWKEEHLKSGYDLLNTPHIAKLDLWRKSGHTEYYKENMYSPMLIDDVEYELKPMNCPFHINVYSSKIRSYRQLPIRYAELGTVYRYERSGVLHGTLRVRGFTQDDAHVFCRPDQLEAEIVEILDFNMFFLNSFGFKEFEIFLSTRPEKFAGSEESWDLATDALANALKIREIEYEVDPGEGVFYGPKIDIKIRDVLKRSWQCTTIQVDFNNPERFDLHFVGEDGGQHRPIMIHRALLGSLERFFGILIEHYAGAFPVWLAPTQAIVIPITERHQEYAAQCLERISGSGIRAQLDDRNEKVGYKIREAETQKIPYMLIIGDKEVEGGVVSLRKRRKGDVGQIDLDNLISTIGKEVVEKSMET